jgi:hypothetical protein
MKYRGLVVYKNTKKGDVIASSVESRKAIRNRRLIHIGRGKSEYLVIQ